jgi:hypothetical protein
MGLYSWRSSRTCSAPVERETSFATPESSESIELSIVPQASQQGILAFPDLLETRNQSTDFKSVL